MKNILILVIFGAQNPEETSHQMIINVSTLYLKSVASVPCEKQITLQTSCVRQS